MGDIRDEDAQSTVAQVSTTKDIAYWEKTTLNFFSNFLRSYPTDLHQKYLSFYQEAIIPLLGPAPSPSRRWTPNLTHTPSPFEPSWNLQDDGSSQIRFCFEPIGPDAGTPTDPFNQSLALSFVSQLTTSTCPTLDTSWWLHFTQELFISPEDASSIVGKIPPTLPSSFIAFDLPRETFAPILKAYLFPQRRAFLTKTAPSAVIFSSIHSLNNDSLLPALSKIESFIPTLDDGLAALTPDVSNLHGLNVDMMAIDCISPAQARVKIYARTYNMRFSAIQDIYTFSGSRPVSEQNLAAFKQFWIAVLGIEDVQQEVERVDARSAGCEFGFEIASGKEWPDVKVYIPTWHFVGSDASLGRRLGMYFKERGWGVGEGYSEEIQLLLDDAEGLEKEPGRHTYISFAFNEKKGVYVTMYYAPKLD